MAAMLAVTTTAAGSSPQTALRTIMAEHTAALIPAAYLARLMSVKGTRPKPPPPPTQGGRRKRSAEGIVPSSEGPKHDDVPRHRRAGDDPSVGEEQINARLRRRIDVQRV